MCLANQQLAGIRWYIPASNHNNQGGSKKLFSGADGLLGSANGRRLELGTGGVSPPAGWPGSGLKPREEL